MLLAPQYGNGAAPIVPYLWQLVTICLMVAAWTNLGCQKNIKWQVTRRALPEEPSVPVPAVREVPLVRDIIRGRDDA
jgi:hypothetical protein